MWVSVTKRFRVSAAAVDQSVDDEVGLDIIVIIFTSVPNTLIPTLPSR
jgi:hypothetical protein